MSKSPRITADDTPPEHGDPADVLNANRDLWERIADSDLPLSEPVGKALEQIDEEGGRDA